LSRISSTNTPTQINYNARGVHVIINVSSVGATGGLTPSIQGVDPISGNFYNVLIAPSPITSIGTYVYEVYPGIGAGSNDVKSRVSSALPRSWRVSITHIDSTIYTYSVGFVLIN
jgi:hypothetical protein